MSSLRRFGRLAASVGLLVLCTPAYGQRQGGGERERVEGNGEQRGGGRESGGRGERGGGRRAVPEFDPAVAGAIGALLAGGAVILARRRKR